MPARPTTSRARRAPRLLLAFVGLVLAVTGLLATASPAAAHATLVSVDPADGARLDEGPDEVRLTFSEHVSVSLGGVRVVGPDGVRADEGAVRADGEVVTVGLRDDLEDGTYVITYRIISADGHPVRGASVFGVGSDEIDLAAAERLGDDGDDRAWEVVGAVGRGLAYGGTLLAAGGVLFLVTAHRGDDQRRPLVRLARLAAVVGGLAGVVALPVQAALGTGQGAGALFDDGVLAEVVDDGVGLGLLLAVVGLVVALVALDRQPVVAAVGAVVGAGSFAATGHTRAGDATALATVADAVHLVVVALWVGGIAFLLALLLLRRRAGVTAAEGTGAVVVRFARSATVGLLGAAATGAVLAWHEVRTLDALTGTGYGRLLLAKLAAVAVVAAAGAYNHVRLVPAVQQGKVRAAMRHLHRTLALEAVGVLVVVGLTAVLVVVTPGRTEAAGGPVERLVELGEVGSVQVVVAPARAGFNQIHLYTYDPAGRPTELAESIDLELEQPGAGIGPLQRTATRAGPAHAQLNSDDLAVGGTWELTLRVRLDRFTEVSGRTEIPVAR